MRKLTVHSESCSVWNDGQLKKTGMHDLECMDCAAESSLSIIKSKGIWRWDIYIPPDWKFGDWSKISLFLVKVEVHFIKCDICGAIYRVYPSFVISGTSLTIFALTFIAFAYECSGLAWRDLPKYFCHGRDVISHSALYKAVHGLALALSECYCRISESIQNLKDKYLSAFGNNQEVPHWPSSKSILMHTIKRENVLRTFLSEILPFDYDTHNFFRLFHTYLKKARMILSNMDPPVKTLYFYKN